MTTVETTRPKVLRKLVIDEFSFVDAPASVGSDVLVWKRHDGEAVGTGSALAEYEAEVARAMGADPTLDVSTASTRAMKSDPGLYERYHAELHGLRPAPVVKAEPDHRAEIRKAVAGDDFAELDRLVRLPDGGRQYHEMLVAGELAEAVEQGIAKRSRTPADVPAAEVARWRERIRSLLKAKDQKGLEAARRQGGAAFEAAWVAMATAGERMTM
jgi:hypothetical protein